jgi:parvulin-like peptidyl-prolyl isomerase
MKVISNLLILFLSLNLYSQAKKEEVIAKVNGEPILSSEFNKNKEMLIEQYSSISPDFMSQKDSEKNINKMVMDKLISEALLRQKAQEMKIKIYERQIDDGIAEIKKRFPAKTSKEADDMLFQELNKQNMTMSEFREKIKRDLMARKLVEDVIRSKVKDPKEEDIKKYYDTVLSIMNNKAKPENMKEEDFQEYTNVANKFKELISERLRLRHILIKPETNDIVGKNKALELANKVKSELDNGADFEDLAAKYSQDAQSASRGGDIGYVIKGMLPKELDDVVFKMCPGDISKPIETQFGYHIVRVDEKRIAQKLKYELAHDDIENIIRQNIFADEVDKYVNELRAKAKIEIFNDK